MYWPHSRWQWAFVLTALTQAVIVLAFEAYVFATLQIDLQKDDGGTSDEQGEQAKTTVPTFLTLYIFGFIYQLVLVYDALRLKNTIQVIGLCLYNVGLLIYGAVQGHQLQEEIDPSIWSQTRPFLIAIPCILALGTILLSLEAWKLYDEFAWTIYKHISADLLLKRKYLTYQIYIALLKFDFFFFLGFTVQFVVIVIDKRSVEFALTVAAIPVTILILITAALFTREEYIWGMISVIILYFGGLAYFLFKIIRIYSEQRREAFRPAQKELTTFAALTIILIVTTIIYACMCTHNFNKGLKPYVGRQKGEQDDEKGYGGMQGTEMTGGPNASRLSMPSRIEID